MRSLTFIFVICILFSCSQDPDSGFLQSHENIQLDTIKDGFKNAMLDARFDKADDFLDEWLMLINGKNESYYIAYHLSKSKILRRFKKYDQQKVELDKALDISTALNDYERIAETSQELFQYYQMNSSFIGLTMVSCS